MRIFRAADTHAVPWKNGLGTTREILRHPAGAADFVYRLSIAEVTRSCAFSAFPGYDRTIMLLAGDGFALDFQDGRKHALTRRHVPFDFDGGVPATCTVAGRPSQDLNLMVRRGGAAADCGVRDIAGRLILPPVPGSLRIVVSLAEGITLRRDSEAATPGRWDTVCLDAASGELGEVVCESAGPAQIFHAVISLGGSCVARER